jgi:exopolyphosphatase/guanosine-5'-triphosphate,3'-diphosphate pyrophosphatase
MDRLGVGEVAVVGTQALREASNAAAFRGPAEQILGTAIEVIAGAREAELVARAVGGSFPELASADHVIADVGGGSTEIIVRSGGRTVSAVSVPLGAVRQKERHLRSDAPAPEEARALLADIDAVLAGLDLPAGGPLIGTAGTATTVASVELKLRVYDPDRVQGMQVDAATVERQLARFLELPLAERRRLPGLAPERADVIAAGIAIYARLLRRLGADRFVISDRGVRWGVVYERLGRQ